MSQPVLEPKTQSFIDAVSSQGGKPLYTLSYSDARKVLENAQSGEIVEAPAAIEDRRFPVGPTGEVSVRIYRPVGVKGPLPVVMYFMLRLVNSKELMGEHRNRLWFNVIAWATAIIVTLLSLLLVWRSIHG